MSKIRIHIEPNLHEGKKLNLSIDQSHYLKNVMRKKVNDPIYCFNENSGEWLSKIISIDKNVSIEVESALNKNTPSDLDIWICFSLIKPRNINFLIEKVSELGVKRIIPIKSHYSEKIIVNLNRLNKIAIEAVEQSGGISIPKIEETVSLSNIFSYWDKDRVIVICDERGKCENIYKFIMNKDYKKLAIFLGPIAGWSKSDIDIFNSQTKSYFVSLGSRILKADTAAIYALSCCNSLLTEKYEK